MKLSELNTDNIEQLNISDKQLESIVFTGATDKIIPSAAAIVLGGGPQIAIARAKMAANFYCKGGTKTLIVSGGVKHEYNEEKISEAELMKRCLMDEGVPECDIIVENRARFTSENMIFSYPEAIWKFGEEAVRSITVITSSWHMRRSIFLAKYFLPAKTAIYGYTENIKEDMEEYKKDATLNLFVKKEVCWLQLNISRGWMDDIEF